MSPEHVFRSTFFRVFGSRYTQKEGLGVIVLVNSRSTSRFEFLPYHASAPVHIPGAA